MHRQQQSLNIPMEIIRSLVMISETGSFSKAGERLGLSQPAIGAQVKKLQNLVGGAVFDRSAGAVTLTERGTVVLSHAKKLLAANDKIILLSGANDAPVPIRVGLANVFVEAFFRRWASRDYNGQIQFTCAQSGHLSKLWLTATSTWRACSILPPIAI
jgi:DNA-binding transcriptional LysR family regulator